jgi:hypothetical protein
MNSKRAAVVTAVTLVPLAVFGGVGFAKGNPSASEYQYGPSGHQYGGKVAVCHKTGSRKHSWHRINVAAAAWNHGHSHHGDFLIDSSHPCPPVTGAAPTAPTTHGKSGEHHGESGDDQGNNGHHGKH